MAGNKWLVSEMSKAREHHADTSAITRANDFAVRDGTTGLNDGLYAVPSGVLDGVWFGHKTIRGQTRPFAPFTRFAESVNRRIDA